MVCLASTDSNLVNLFQLLLAFGHIRKVLKHNVELIGQLLRAIILSIVRQSRIPHIHDHFLKKSASIFTLTKSLELLQIEEAALIFIHHIE